MIIDVAPMLEQKTAAAMCHRTQHALFVSAAGPKKPGVP